MREGRHIFIKLHVLIQPRILDLTFIQFSNALHVLIAQGYVNRIRCTHARFDGEVHPTNGIPKFIHMRAASPTITYPLPPNLGNALNRLLARDAHYVPSIDHFLIVVRFLDGL